MNRNRNYAKTKPEIKIAHRRTNVFQGLKLYRKKSICFLTHKVDNWQHKARFAASFLEVAAKKPGPQQAVSSAPFLPQFQVYLTSLVLPQRWPQVLGPPKPACINELQNGQGRIQQPIWPTCSFSACALVSSYRRAINKSEFGFNLVANSMLLRHGLAMTLLIRH